MIKDLWNDDQKSILKTLCPLSRLLCLNVVALLMLFLHVTLPIAFQIHFLLQQFCHAVRVENTSKSP